MKGAEPDLSAATFQIHDESHTMGNALRWMLMKTVGQTSFCFYPWPIILRGCFFLNVARRLNFVDTGKHCSPLLTLFILLLWHCVQFVLFLSFVVAAFNLCHFLIVTLFLSVPHPSENHIQIRIQMYGGLSLPPSSSSLEI